MIDLHKNGTHSLASKSKPISKTKLKAKPAQAKKVVKKAKVAPKKAKKAEKVEKVEKKKEQSLDDIISE